MPPTRRMAGLQRGICAGGLACEDWPMRRPIAAPGSAPTEAALHAAALTHLARYATTRAGLIAVLDRRIARWLRASERDETTEAAAAAARAAARRVADKLVALGVVNDAAFAENRARSLTRAGRSRRAVAAHLAARGIGAETAQTALPDDPEAELAAAVAHARRRRLGPFRTAPADPARQVKELAAFARAGFSRDVALQALRMDHDTAEALLRAARTA
jgi:regulatory protein